MSGQFVKARATHGGAPQRRYRAICGCALLAMLLSCLASASPAAAQTTAAMPPSPWRDTGLPFSLRVETTCFDPTMPTLLITSERQSDTTGAARMTYVNNYATGQRSLVAMRGYDRCNRQTGSLFTLNADGATALRFSPHDPVGRTVDHYPDAIAPDGSVLYATGDTYYPRGIVPAAPGRLFVSTDDGQTWQERGTQFNGTIAAIAPVDAAAQSLYALVTASATDGGQAAGGLPYTIAFSADAGATWEQRSTGLLAYVPFYHASGGLTLFGIPGATTPPTTVGLAITPPGAGPHVTTDVQLSADGGRTFTSVGSILYGSTGFDNNTTFNATSAGIIRTTLTDLALSTDGGATFAPLTPPVPSPDGHYGSPQIVVAPTAPNIVLFFIQGTPQSDLYLSQDGGKSWARLATNPGRSGFSPFDSSFAFTPTNPPSLLTFTSNGTSNGMSSGLLVLDLATNGSGNPMPAAAPTVGAPNFTRPLAALTARGSAAANLGAPTGNAYTENGIAILGFEGGVMLYLPHQNAFYALVSPPGGALTVIPRTFGDAGLTTTLAPGPRPNTFVPRLGFGQVWQSNPALQQVLGYATGDERRFTDAAQLFQNGVIVADIANNAVYVLNTATGVWDRASAAA